MAATDPTRRFTDRVDAYVRYRPSYPPAVLDVLRDQAGLTPGSAVADIGSGTGIFAELLLRNGYTVYGVEPNDAMRQAAERLLAGHANFHSVAGTAEATTLPDRSVDFVVAAQAFHWFDRDMARREFDRVLRVPGRVALVFNSRKTDATPFLRDYERLLQDLGTDYQRVDHTKLGPEVFARFFGPCGYERRALPNEQRLDLDGLRGRLLSASYTPPPGHPDHEPLLRRIEEMFHAHERGGVVTIEYETEVYYGLA
jgi:SAM-dependent methyltransferase